MNTKKLTRKQQGLVIAGVILLALLTIYLGIAVYFNSHFLFRTMINGVEASTKSVKSVERLITEEIDEYRINIEPRNGEAEPIEGTAIELKPVFDGMLEVKLREQNHFAWPVALFQDTTIEVETMVDYDKEKLRRRQRSWSLWMSPRCRKQKMQ